MNCIRLCCSVVVMAMTFLSVIANQLHVQRMLEMHFIDISAELYEWRCLDNWLPSPPLFR